MVESIWSDIYVKHCSEVKILPKIQSNGDETSLKQTKKIHLMTKKRTKNNPLMMNNYLF
ncbi:hypothetical protein DPMN_191342 [Dreissena polymorpha]|uniref:Uncharacterized protein n=1 Tax=Dreissena polymorpha TaxID=45954 RepID=A0A9D3Y0Y3_DREPO|nr:hypothetical protein DPMN_191342 [Dreissena polymorpha]